MPGGRGHVVGDAVHLQGGPGPPGDSGKERRVVHLLQSAHQLLTQHVPATDQEHGRVGRVRRRHRGDGVGDTRSGGHHRHPQPARQPAVCLGGVTGRLLMAEVDDPDPLLHAAVEDGEDVAPGDGEQGVDALGLEGSGSDLTAVDLGHGARLVRPGADAATGSESAKAAMT